MVGFAFTAVDLLHWEKLKEKRDKKGSEWCRDKGIGKERQLLLPRPASVVPFRKVEIAERAMEQAKSDTYEALGSICRSCGRCVLAE